MSGADGVATPPAVLAFGARAGPALSAGVVAVTSLLSSVAGAQNFAPIASATATPTEVQVGEDVAFSSAGSTDPDAGPGPLQFAWDFGDGDTATTAEPTHAYAAPGFYAVTLTVSDGDRQTLALLEVAVLAPVTPEPPARSAPLVVTPDGAEVWAVNTDSSSISVVDTASGAVTELDVGAEPRSLALHPATSELFVACGDGTLSVVDTAAREVSRSRRVGRRLFGVAVVPGSGRVAVSDEATGRVVLLDAGADTELGAADVGGTPRAIAVPSDGSRLYVSHFLTPGATGTVSALDPVSLAASDIPLVENPGPDTATSGAGFPNLLGVLGIEPSGRRLWVGGLKANTSRGAYLDGELLVPRNRLRGLLAPVDLSSDTEIPVRRIDTNDADRVSGLAFSPSGRYAYLVHQGAGTLSVYDLVAATIHDSSDGDTVPFEARVDVGEAPRGVAVSPDGSRLYVLAYLSREVLVLDVADPAAPAIVERIALSPEPLSPRMLNGKRLFFRSKEPVHSDQNYIACASCHPEGGLDARTWDFTQFGEGLRNTIDLRGRAGTGHGPVHWSANFDEIQDFENDIVGGFGGTGLLGAGLDPHPPLGVPNAGRSDDLDDLALYVASLAEPPSSPYRTPDGALTEAAVRGRAIFFDPDRRCTQCHLPPRFTDSRLDDVEGALYDVGTLTAASGQRLGAPLDGIDTPTVLGVWAGAPYLHDGSAPTLRAVLVDRNPDDAHGRTSDLDDAQVDDLVAYLRSLDGSADEIEPGWVPPPEPDAGTPVDAGAMGDAGGPADDEDAGRDAADAPREDLTGPGDGGAVAAADDAGAPAEAGGGGCGCRIERSGGRAAPCAWWALASAAVLRRVRRRLPR